MHMIVRERTARKRRPNKYSGYIHSTEWCCDKGIAQDGLRRMDGVSEGGRLSQGVKKCEVRLEKRPLELGH